VSYGRDVSALFSTDIAYHLCTDVDSQSIPVLVEK